MGIPHLVVIGASSGIGAECVKRFAGKYSVSGLSRRGIIPEGVDPIIACGFACDATSLDSLKSAAESAVERFGKISAVVVSSGVQIIKPIRAFKESDIKIMLNSNVGLPFNVASVLSSQRFSMSDSVFCFISSISALRPDAGIVLYGATKSATESLVAGLAKELAPRRVVGVAPGWLDTPMTQKFSHIYNEKFKNDLLEKTPLGGLELVDVINSIDFLLSPSASKITGQVLVVDGGASL